MRWLWCAGFMWVSVLTISFAWAHGDGEKPRFVSAAGEDRGACTNRFRPCKTIHYAASRADKGDSVLVEKGRYTLESEEDFLFLLTGLSEVQGGYTRVDHFQKQDPEANLTFLTGVPAEYRARLIEKGFRVIADRKILSAVMSAKIKTMMKTFEALRQSKADVPCIGDSAGAFACHRIDLLSHVAFSSMSILPNGGNDVWGYADLNTGREYAFVGLDNGMVVFDVTDPVAPVEVGAVSGEVTGWRDIKVYQYYDTSALRWKAYAYVTADAARDRLVVMDLSGLPNRVVFAGRSGDLSAHNVYIGNVDYSFGIANGPQIPRMHVAGANQSGGAFRTYHLTNPESPEFVAVGTRGYTHDASSMTIVDARKDTQCAEVRASCDVMFDFNEGSIEIWDVSGNTPAHLSSSVYPNLGYVHSGWWSEDRMYLFVHDEFDEQRYGLSSTVRVFDLSNLRSPQMAGIWTGETQAIDHNGYARGNRYYISNYTRGLTVLDISNPATPGEVGYFDSFPFSDSATFNGAWGVYPFLPSGVVLLGDVNGGLFVLRDKTLDSAQGRLKFAAASYYVEEGVQLSVTVDRSQGGQGAVTVDIEVVHATVDGADYQLAGQSLSWADGEQGAKSLMLDVVADADAEEMERLILRLVNPRSGAVLATPNIAEVYIAEAGAAPLLALLETEVVVNRITGRAFVAVKRLGQATSAAAVNYRTLEGSALAGQDFTAVTNGILQWIAGDARAKLIEIEISASTDTATETFSVELYNPSGASINGPAVASVSLSSAPAAPVFTPTPPPAASRRSGGGWLDVGLLLLFAVFYRLRRRRYSG